MRTWLLIKVIISHRLVGFKLILVPFLYNCGTGSRLILLSFAICREAVALLASHADILRGLSRIPAPRRGGAGRIGECCVTSQKNVCRGSYSFVGGLKV